MRAMKFELQTLEDYTDEALLEELRRVADALKGQRMTRERFNSMARVHSTTLRYRFGSWRAALDKAGITEAVAPRFKVLSREAVLHALREFSSENPGQSITEKALAGHLGLRRGTIIRRFGKWETLLAEVGLQPVPLGRRYTDEECYENIIALWTHYGRQPNFAELNRPPSTVGSKAYVRRWGGWRAALGAFIKYVNQEPRAVQAPIAEKPGIETSTSESAPAVPPRSISLSLRYKVLSRDKFRCRKCGRSPATDPTVVLHVDHAYPWSKSGKNTEENLRTLCFECNLGKGARIENE